MVANTRKTETDESDISWWDSAVVAVYLERYPDLVKVAMRYMDTTARSEDVVQDVLMRCHAGRARPEPGREFSYLRTAVLNGARDRLRHRQVVDRHARSLARPNLVEPDWREHLATADVLWAALERLPQRQRQVLVLRHVHQMSEADTANALTLSLGSVKTHASRGRTRLRNELSEAWV